MDVYGLDLVESQLFREKIFEELRLSGRPVRTYELFEVINKGGSEFAGVSFTFALSTLKREGNIVVHGEWVRYVE